MPEQLLSSNTFPAEQSNTLEQHIMARTGRQVRALHVEATADRVCVSGIALRFHVKQLVLAAIREVSGSVAVDLNIQVR